MGTVALATRWSAHPSPGRATEAPGTLRRARARRLGVQAWNALGASDSRYSSRASMIRPNGSSRSNSAALPLNARHPRSSARRRSSSRSEDLPIPGSPVTNTIWGDPAHPSSSMRSSRSNSVCSANERLGQFGHCHTQLACSGQHTPRGPEERRDQGGHRCRAGRRFANTGHMPRYILEHRHSAQGVRRGVRLVQGVREPAAPPGGAPPRAASAPTGSGGSWKRRRRPRLYRSCRTTWRSERPRPAFGSCRCPDPLGASSGCPLMSEGARGGEAPHAHRPHRRS